MEPRKKIGDKGQTLKRCCSRVKCFIGKSDFNSFRVSLPFLFSVCQCDASTNSFLLADTDAGFNPTPSKVWIYF